MGRPCSPFCRGGNYGSKPGNGLSGDGSKKWQKWDLSSLFQDSNQEMGWEKRKEEKGE